MTAVALAHLIIQQGGNVLGVVADSGVPGSQPALPASVPISLFACRRPWEFWHCGMIECVWRAQGYTVNFIHEAGYSNYAFLYRSLYAPVNSSNSIKKFRITKIPELKSIFFVLQRMSTRSTPLW